MVNRENAILRRLVATYLDTRERRDKLYLLEDVATLFILAADVRCNDEIKCDVSKVIHSAFAQGSGEYEDVVSYADIGLTTSQCSLYVKRYRPTDRSGQRWIVVIGCFATEEDIEEAKLGAPPMTINVGLGVNDSLQLVGVLEKKSKGKTSSAADDVEDRLNEVLERNNALEKELERMKDKLEELEGAASLVDENERARTPPRGCPTCTKRQRTDDGTYKPKTTMTLYFILEGRAGEIDIDLDGRISITDLKANILCEHLCADDLDDINGAALKRITTYTPKRINGVDVFECVGVTVNCNNQLSRIETQAGKIGKFREYFFGGKCKWTREHMRHIIGFSMHDGGGSDQGLTMVLYGAFKVANMMLDAGLTNLQIGNGIPSNEMIKNHEFKQAAESYLTVCDEVSKSKYYTLATDGGNKKGLEHLAKVIYYAKVVPGENGSKAKLRFGKFCIDIDISGKKADEIADAIEKSLKRFSDYVEAECVGMTGDAGGGGAVQTVFRHLREKIASLRRQLRCLLHAYNNCLKIAICSAMGPSGMNQDTCSQLVYAAINMIITIRKQGGREMYDELSRLVKEEIMSNASWQLEGDRVLKQFTDELFEWINGDDFEAVLKDYETGMRNLQLPLATRWQTMIPGIKIVAQCPVFIYFMAKVAAKKEDSGSYLQQCANDVIGLMRLKAQGGTSSQLLAQLLFIDGFAEAVYNNFFTLACRAEDRFGSDSQGFNTGKCVARCYLMQNQINQLQSEGGLARAPAFARYLKALEGMPSLGDPENGGIEYYKDMEQQFFSSCLTTFKEHVEDVWTHEDNLLLLLGGDPELAKEFAKCLYYNAEIAIPDEDGHVDRYTWPDEDVELEGHDIRGGTTTVNIRDIMSYLFKDQSQDGKANVIKILEDPLITAEKTLLWQFANAEGVVDLFDETTWGDVDFKPLQTLVHTRILIHSAHNQGVESYIYATGVVRKTGVGESRATARMMIHSHLIRRFNSESVAARKEELKKEGKEEAAKKVIRLKDKRRTVPFADKMDCHNETVKTMEKSDGYKSKYDKLLKDLMSGEKQSDIDDEKKLNTYKEAIEKVEPTVTQAQTKDTMYIPPAIGKTMRVTFLRAGEGDVHKNAMLKEIAARKISVEDDVLQAMNWRAKQNLLRVHELGELAKASKAIKTDGKPMLVSDVSLITPQSAELKALLPEHIIWLAEKQSKKRSE